jgi:hypothetical protein
MRKTSGDIRTGFLLPETMIQRMRVGIFGIITRRNTGRTMGSNVQAEYLILRGMKIEATGVAGEDGYGLHQEIRARQASEITAITGEMNVGIVHVENGYLPTQMMLEVLAVIKNQKGHKAHQPISMLQPL